MSNSGPASQPRVPTRCSPGSARSPPFAELGTAGYPRAVRRRLTIVNAMAFLIAFFSVVYALVFAYYDAQPYMPLIVANLLLVGVALAVPLAHRINDIAAALGARRRRIYRPVLFRRAPSATTSGIQINYIIAAAVAFAIYGMSRFRLVVAVISIGLAAASREPGSCSRRNALCITADPRLLANLYVSSAVTTFCIIALIVGYAFTVADRARAEADALLANILPEAIAERLKEGPASGSPTALTRPRSCSAISSASPSSPSGSARHAPWRFSIRSSPSSTGWRRRTAWRRSRPSATATWRWPA